MNLKADMLADLDSVFFNTDEFADEVVYTPAATGVADTIKAMVDYGIDQNASGIKGSGYTWTVLCERDVRSDFRSGSTRSVATIMIMAADVPEPKVRDTITAGGIVWKITKVFDRES